MAGQAQRGSRGRGRTSRPGSSVTPRAAGYAGARGSAAIPTTVSPTGQAPDPGIQLATRQTYRQLTLRGMTANEAANLTAFLCGIPVADVHWSLRQVNQLLFLRELARSGRFGPRDGGPPRPH